MTDHSPPGLGVPPTAAAPDLSEDVWEWKDIHGWKTLPHWLLKLSTKEHLKVQKERYDSTSNLPVLGGSRPAAAAGAAKTDDEIRFLLYGEVMQAWRQLTDVRFRLMNMLPAVSIVGIIPLLVLASQAEWHLQLAGVALALLGLQMTHGLHVYEQRNDGLYDDLMSRGRKIESELGIQSGVMLNRPKAQDESIRPKRSRINHGRGTRLVFSSVKYAWAIVAIVLAASLVIDLLDDADKADVDLPVEVEHRIVEPG